jgi:hypothetical protein
MKIRIVQAGYETFNGLLGDVKFENGLSIKDVSGEQAAYVRSIFTTEEVSDEQSDESAQSDSVDPQAQKDLTPEGQDEGEKPQEQAELTLEGQDAEGAAE